MNKTLKRQVSPAAITTDGLRSSGAAMIELGCREKQEIGRWANNEVENGNQSFRQRERTMLRFRRMSSHFSLERHLVIDRPTRNAAQLP